MEKIIITKEYSCFVFGEGRKDKNFLMALIDLKKFEDHTQGWTFNYGNASGGPAKVILEKCRKEVSGHNYNLILCFIDLDRLKQDSPKKWKKEKMELEEQYSEFKIIWQFDKAEDEYRKVIGNQCKGKHKLNKIAKQEVEKFINSDFWKRILKSIKNKERELDEIRKELKK